MDSGSSLSLRSISAGSTFLFDQFEVRRSSFYDPLCSLLWLGPWSVCRFILLNKGPFRPTYIRGKRFKKILHWRMLSWLLLRHSQSHLRIVIFENVIISFENFKPVFTGLILVNIIVSVATFKSNSGEYLSHT